MRCCCFFFFRLFAILWSFEYGDGGNRKIISSACFHSFLLRWNWNVKIQIYSEKFDRRYERQHERIDFSKLLEAQLVMMQTEWLYQSLASTPQYLIFHNFAIERNLKRMAIRWYF